MSFPGGGGDLNFENPQLLGQRGFQSSYGTSIWGGGGGGSDNGHQKWRFRGKSLVLNRHNENSSLRN